MNGDAKLVAIAGPLKGATFTLSEARFSVGRDRSNSLGIDDDRLSPRHCLIKREGSQYKVTDLGSLDGTFVNGLQVKEHLLRPSDQIKIGSSLFRLHPAETKPGASPVRLNEEDSTPQSTVEVRPVEALDSPSEGPPFSLPSTDRTIRDLKALLRISGAIGGLRGLEGLQRKLMESCLEVVPADRCAIFLVGDDPEDFTSIFGYDRVPRLDRPMQVSRSAITHALRERLALLSNDVRRSDLLGQAEDSPDLSPIRSLLAVPLLISGKTLGVIYLDSSDPDVRFDENHLEMVTGIAGVGAIALDNGRRAEWLENERQRLQAEIDIEHNMVGESSRMREVYQFIAKVAPTDSTVLISGESGTGKELVARALYRNSPRAGRPFVAINCAALTETLLESELFGHERGAFTGAVAQKKGKLEAADGGTVFLDEVGELAPALQSKLLRVLQEREFERVGGTRPVKVDIRLIAATNRDLNESVKRGAFRQDLYYRLNVVPLAMPPLRERREDIGPLASHFAAKHGKNSRRQSLGVSAEARACLMNYPWPGNVRELENAIERAVVLGSRDLIVPEDLPEAVLEAHPASGACPTKYHEAVKEAKKQLVLKALERAAGSYTEAAKLLGVHPNYLHRLVRNLGLRAPIGD
jgi:transcriptional regulator with GAF, ATPase, and Fis domain